MVSIKGQAELALILGLIIVGIFIAYFAVISIPIVPLEPASLSDDQRAVELYVKDAIRKSSENVIRNIYYSGGYYELDGQKTTEFFGGEVAYWQECATEHIPDVEKNFIEGLEKDLKKYIPGKTDIAGRQVVFGIEDTRVGAQFYDNSISLEVTIATTIDGSPVPQPYRLEIPTKISRITEFAEDFTRFQIKYRALDKNLMKIVNRTNPVDEEGSCWLPTRGIYEGMLLKKSWTSLRGCMEKAIDYTLGNTLEWIQPIMDGDTLPLDMLDYVYIFNIETDDGWGQYPDLDPDFYMGGENARLTKGNPEFTFRTHPDPVKFKVPMNIFLIPPRLTYDVKYDVSFPVVISVYDDLSERSFMFANFINIRESVPSNDCSEAETVDQNALICETGAETPVSIIVNSYEPPPDNHVPGVFVTYGECDIGITEGDGSISRNFPELGPDKKLTFIKDDGLLSTEYSICTSTENIPRTVQLPLNKNFDVIIRIVDIIRRPSTDGFIYSASVRYPVTEDDRVFVNLARKNIPCMDPEEYVIMNYNASFADDNIIYDVYPVSYPLSGVTLPATAEYTASIGVETWGTAEIDTVIDYNRDRLYVYAPLFEEGDEVNIEQMFDTCGISPVAGEDLKYLIESCEVLI